MRQLIVDVLIVNILQPLEDLATATAKNLFDGKVDLISLIFEGLPKTEEVFEGFQDLQDIILL
jgi:hypothetical protein